MSEGYDEDLRRWLEASGAGERALDSRALLRPIGSLPYPRDPACVAPGDAAGKALDLMAGRNVGALLVVADGRVVGIFSERDALRKGLYRGGLDRPVREFMTADPDCLTPHDTIAFAMNRMGMGGYRHVPLVDAGRRPVGILVMRDVVRYLVGFFPKEVRNVPPHSEHSPPERHAHGG